jgi:hypothetical protein
LYGRLYLVFSDVEDVRIWRDYQTFSVLYQYLLLSKLKRLPAICSRPLIAICDRDYDRVRVTKLFDTNRKHIILNNNGTSSLSNLSDLIEHVDPTQTSMLTAILFKVELLSLNPVHDPICLRDWIAMYNDPSKMYDHTLRNILDFHQVDWSTWSTLCIRMAQRGKIMQVQIPVSRVIDIHLNDLIDVDFLSTYQDPVH